MLWCFRSCFRCLFGFTLWFPWIWRECFCFQIVCFSKSLLGFDNSLCFFICCALANHIPENIWRYLVVSVVPFCDFLFFTCCHCENVWFTGHLLWCPVFVFTVCLNCSFWTLFNHEYIFCFLYELLRNSAQHWILSIIMLLPFPFSVLVMSAACASTSVYFYSSTLSILFCMQTTWGCESIFALVQYYEFLRSLFQGMGRRIMHKLLENSVRSFSILSNEWMTFQVMF